MSWIVQNIKAEWSYNQIHNQLIKYQYESIPTVDPAVGQVLCGKEELVQTANSCPLAYCTYVGFAKSLSGYLWSLIPVLNQKLNLQMSHLFLNILTSMVI